MPKFTIVALQGANGTKQSLKVPTAIKGAELKVRRILETYL